MHRRDLVLDRRLGQLAQLCIDDPKSKTSSTLTVNSGSNAEVACVPRAKRPCSAYFVRSNVSTVIVLVCGLTIQ
jgi:hypothetical protein